MRRTFNCGVGLVAVVAEGAATRALSALAAAGERAFTLGSVETCEGGAEAHVAYLGE
jgi:phosphoribosylformylglycinamidine cyclo-ligase